MKSVNRLVLVAVIVFAANGCDQGSRYVSQADLHKVVESTCIETALKSVEPTVQRTPYVSDGTDNFPKGTSVSQFTYQDEQGDGGFTLGVGRLPNGETRIYNAWSKLGTINSTEMARASDVIEHVNEAMQERCGLPKESFRSNLEGKLSR